MTLLEALVALVILGLSAVGYLQRFRVDAQGIQRAVSWEQTVATAESAMEEAKLQPAGGLTTSGASRDVAVEVAPWRGRVRDIQVSVRLPDGTTFTLHRLRRGE